LAYKADLTAIEQSLKKSLLALDTPLVLKVLSHYDNKRTLNRKLSALNAFFNFCYKQEFHHEQTKFRLSKIPKLLPKFLSF